LRGVPGSHDMGLALQFCQIILRAAVDAFCHAKLSFWRLVRFAPVAVKGKRRAPCCISLELERQRGQDQGGGDEVGVPVTR
jgi:hypothetical protein